MNGTAHAGVAVLALVYLAAWALVRWAVSPGSPAKHRASRGPRRIEVEVRGRDLIPALAGRAYGAVAPQAVAHCPPCGGLVPVVVHGTAHRCDTGHITIHTTTGDHR